MKQMTSNEIRTMWLDFWNNKNHLTVPSANLIPINDNSLLWINAGVTPLKKFFDGSSVPENKRLVNIQKCIRTNDIESVGDTTHLTFFEMLGNFSVGNYFKEEAIIWAYELLTSDQYFAINKNRLYFTVHPSDIESKELWLKLGVKQSHILELENNYWEIGEGPAGPCSEIFYDRGDKYDPENIGVTLLKDDMPNDRYVEIWNIVFSAFNAVAGVDRKDYQDLPSKNIDTGMGLERISMIAQAVDSIYDTDLFTLIIKQIELISRSSYQNQPEYRIIADHIRTITMALKDGASFGNTGRGYILRRLLRRAVRTGQKLKINNNFLYRLVPVVANIMQDYHQFNENDIKRIMDLIVKEESLFHQTLVSGEEKLASILATPGLKTVTGEDAFKLYDTYGFPLELTIEIAREKGISVDTSGFLKLMAEQKNNSQSNTNMVNSMTLQNKDLIECKVESEYVGDTTDHVHTQVIALFDKDGNRVIDLLNSGYIILEKTPFYAESGGQVADKGFMRTAKIADNDKLIVENVIKAPNQQHLHSVRIINGVISQGEPIEAKIDTHFREKVTINHSATHLLHYALKEVLDESVYQAGSSINDKTIRFDFNYTNSVSDENIINIENCVKSLITSSEIIKQEMSLEEAKGLGATALFDEKYGTHVKTVKIGPSFELCGGSHVDDISLIKHFAIVSIESKGASVYRITAATNENVNILLHESVATAKQMIHDLQNKAHSVLKAAKEKGVILAYQAPPELNYLSSYEDVLAYKKVVNDLTETVRLLEKEYQKNVTKQVVADLSEFESKIKDQALIIYTLDLTAAVIKQIIDKIANEHKLDLVFIANVQGANVNFFCKTSPSFSNTLKASDVIQDVANMINGRGGGSTTFAQGGGNLKTDINQVIEHVEKIYQGVTR